jgi:ankyrin repeat protein
MGTSWAVNALLQTLPVQAKTKEPFDLNTPAPADWVGVALNGSAAELKTLLDNKLSPNAKTAAGTTVLMLAARDTEKVKLLLARGAEVNARAATGITPLMIAARYKSNMEVVRLLLQKGAKPNVKQAVRNDASALFYAVMAGDAETAGALIAAGAKLDHPMKVLGTIPTSPLVFAAMGDEARLVDFLISKGAAADAVDRDGLSALAWAVISNHVDTVQVLLARGARVNRVDNFGMTPLLYAASIDFGDTAVLEKLLAAGTDSHAKNKEGQTALDLARRYHHVRAINLLSSKSATR